MISEMVDLGFKSVELSHGIRISLVPGILRALQEGLVTICSTHNFCPLPTGIVTPAPNLFMPSAGEIREREQWLRHTRRSIDFAAQVGAKAVVLHLGSVQFFWMNPARKLRKFIRSNPDLPLPNHEKYRAVLDRASDRLEQKIPGFWQRSKESLLEIIPYAAERGIRLGVENRERFEELPRDCDIGEVFDLPQADLTLGYWHDCGHAQLKEGLGVLVHEEQLRRFGERLLGLHVHDVNEKGQDHQAVGSGKINFEMISRHIQPHHCVVLELSPRLSKDDVLRSRQVLQDALAAV